MYDGELDASGTRHGFGVCGYSNGHLYVGDFRRGMEHGEGELRDASGALIYRGEFEHGRICGRGTFYYGCGTVYRGEMREGLRHGKGVCWGVDGSVFEGEYVYGLRHGSGTFSSPLGQYSGEWSNDMRHGRGTLRLPDGTHLDGSFKDNKPDGRCVVQFPDGSVYEGIFKEGLRDGRGTYTFGANGAVYEGRFRDDSAMGTGTLKLVDGVPLEASNETGEWFTVIELPHEIKWCHWRAGFSMDGT